MMRKLVSLQADINGSQMLVPGHTT